MMWLKTTTKGFGIFVSSRVFGDCLLKAASLGFSSELIRSCNHDYLNFIDTAPFKEHGKCLITKG